MVFRSKSVARIPFDARYEQTRPTHCRRFRFESPLASVSFRVQLWLNFMKCECNSANNIGL